MKFLAVVTPSPDIYQVGTGGGGTMDGRDLYHPTTERDSSIHSNKADIWDMCRDRVESGIISAHALVRS